jgi:hypothetical protein
MILLKYKINGGINMKRITVTLTDEQYERLEQRMTANYSDMSKQIRQAVDMLLGHDKLEQAVRMAKGYHDGHLILMRFTTNWRSCFGTPWGDVRDAIEQMDEGATMEEALTKTMSKGTNAYKFKNNL